MFLRSTLFLLLAAANAVADIRGVVTSGGRPVAGAVVRARGVSATTDAGGRFVLSVDPPVRVRFEAPGLAPQEVDAASPQLSVSLGRISMSETVTVTASRAGLRIGDAPSSTIALGREELETSASPALDDALRSIPGFSLFRRSGSRTANPTAQGVSLRGVGASGASRTTVLDDGVPLNDPFGGWVYWGRVPVTAVERIEVVRGGASDLFGASASSGAIQMVRGRDSGVAADLSAGSEGSSRASLSAAVALPAGSLRFDAERFATDGYVPVAPGERGTVDDEANVARNVVDAGYSLVTEDSRLLFARVSRFEEERANGTPLQGNATELWSASGGADLPLGRTFASLRGFGTDQEYTQTFSSIAADRSSERLTRRQRVPSRSVGFSASSTAQLGRSATVAAGAEWRTVEGRSDEEIVAGDSVIPVSAGGTQRSAAVFAEAVSRPAARLTLITSLRYDAWVNVDASRSSGGVVTPLASRRSGAWSPRVALAARPSARWTITSSAYEAFRAPTLNELYRGFRVGNVVTNANETLEAEKVRGFEAGLRWSSQAASVRANLFSLTTSDPIANATLSVTPGLITRERRNLGRTRSRGLELDAEWRATAALSLAAGWLLSDARVLSFAEAPAVAGNRIPQVPRQQGSLRVTFRAASGAVVSSELRVVGPAFEDDLNEMPLDGYSTLDLFASTPLSSRLDAYGALENAFDAAVEAGRTPVTTHAQPRAWRLGLRWR